MYALMLQGTGSDVGKSLLVAGLCRLFTRRGFTVRPFKPQNMSNNSAVTVDGGEISRAQALQAQACYAEPSVHMNPVLLKPQARGHAQLVVTGQVQGTVTAQSYQTLKPALLSTIIASFHMLASKVDLVVVEGAGSAAEVNLHRHDVANMGFVRMTGVPVVLVGDIDRGGVIASLVGTHALLDTVEREKTKGFLINKFRGDIHLFESALSFITEKTNWPSVGVIPWFDAARCLSAEDSMNISGTKSNTVRTASHSLGGGHVYKDTTRIRIAVPQLPHIANFDDFDPLIAEEDVEVFFVQPGSTIPCNTDIIILPGSKSTLADLASLRAEGWDIDILSHSRRGGSIVGLCAGYQMLGHSVYDPSGIEGCPGEKANGLGLLDVETVLVTPKVLKTVTAREVLSGEQLHGYEMHMGRTDGPDREKRPWFLLEDSPGLMEGARSIDGRIRGCYIHGLFVSDAFRQAFLTTLNPSHTSVLSFTNQVESTLENLADHLESHINTDTLLAIARCYQE